MIVVIARVTTDAARREEFIRVALESVAASRQDAGCISYQLNQDTENENAFVMVEEWESQEALQAHFKTPHIAAFMGAAPGLLTAPPDIQFHMVEKTLGIAEVAG